MSLRIRGHGQRKNVSSYHAAEKCSYSGFGGPAPLHLLTGLSMTVTDLFFALFPAPGCCRNGTSVRCLPACGAKDVPGTKWKMGSENLIYCFLSSVGTPPSLTLGSMTGMILGHHQPLQASALQISDGDSLRRLWIVMEM